MLDRQKVEAILTRRFPGASIQQIGAATNAIMSLDEQRHEALDERRAFGTAAECCDPYYARQEFERFGERHD